MGNIDNSFTIDKSNGNIFTTQPLDREQRKVYEILVKASNDPNEILEKASNPYDKKNGPTGDSSVALVSISVEDENDTPPKFSREIFYAGVPYTAEVEHFVRNIRAEDGDAGKNGSLTYSIRSSTFFRPGESKPVGSIVPSPFNMTKEGRLLTATLMAPYKRHRFLLEVQAKEETKPYRIDTCMVNIWVWERDELIKVVLEQKPEEVVRNQEGIITELSDVLEGTAVVDEIRYFTYTNNSVSRECV
ncbi:Cadherin-87A [Armadillidium vulgare]|nr:Cadherin-87A [Armadillidium vulgare]